MIVTMKTSHSRHVDIGETLGFVPLRQMILSLVIVKIFFDVIITTYSKDIVFSFHINDNMKVHYRLCRGCFISSVSNNLIVKWPQRETNFISSCSLLAMFNCGRYMLGLAIVPLYRRTIVSHCSVARWHNGQSNPGEILPTLEHTIRLFPRSCNTLHFLN